MASINLRQHKDKKWEYRLRYKDPFTKNYKERSKRGYSSKKEARLAAQELERQISNGFVGGPIPLSYFFNKWLHQEKKPSVRRNTFDLYESMLKVHILPYFKNLDLHELTPKLYQEFLNHLGTTKNSFRTNEIIHDIIFNAMKYAVRMEDIEKNPCWNAVIKGQRKNDRESKWIETENIPKFLTTATQYGYIYGLFFRALIETGMRKGEAAAIQWTDIDFKNSLIHVNKTLDFKEPPSAGASKLFGNTKTYSSKRDIPIRSSLLEALRIHQKQQNQYKLTLKDCYFHDLNLVFARNDGSYLPKSTLFNAFSRINKQAHLKPIPIHSLRHTYTVLNMEAGVKTEVIQKRLGHGSERITREVYQHISKKLNADANDQFESYTESIFK